MELRKVFDRIPEQFDKWRPRYCEEVFADVIQYANLDAAKTVLEIGPGTGQATEPILQTGCCDDSMDTGGSRLPQGPSFTKTWWNIRNDDDPNRL